MFGVSAHDFRLVFNSNTWSNGAPVTRYMPSNLSDLELHISVSHTFQYHCHPRSNLMTHVKPPPPFYLVLNSIWPDAPPLWNFYFTFLAIKFETWVTLNFSFQGHSRSRLMAHFNSRHMVLLVLIGNIWPNLSPLWDTSLQNMSNLDMAIQGY